MTLEQRIDNILGPWPTPDQVREAFLLLARHLQRHDELVTLQRDIDAYAECRRMPDDALDALEAHRDRLQQEISDGTPIPHLAKEAEAELDAATERIEELQEGASKADVGPLDPEAIESKAHRLMVATWECDKLSYTDQWRREAREKYGADVVEASEQRARQMSKEAWNALKAEGDAVTRGLAALMERDPGDPEVQALIARHYAWVDHFWHPTAEAYRGLGQLYVENDEFRAQYDAYRPGLADFMQAAMNYYADHTLTA